MKKTTYVMSACFMILLAGCLYYFLKDEPFQPKETVVESKVEQATTLSYTGNSITEEKDGKRLWELGAETIDVDVNTKNVTLKNIKGTFYQDNGGKIEITAPVAFMDSKTKDISMSGKVHAVSSDGGDFTAQETRWSEKDQLFYGSGEILFKKNDTVMSGDKLQSDKNMVNIKLSGHAKILKGGTPQ